MPLIVAPFTAAAVVLLPARADDVVVLWPGPGGAVALRPVLRAK
jgi:hypothetical protein